MSRQPVAGGEGRSRARATNTAPARPPSRHVNAGARREVAPPLDGAGTSAAAMAARPPGRVPNEYVTFREAGAETSVQSVRLGEAARLPGRVPNEYVTFWEAGDETSVQSVHPGEADAPAPVPPHGTPWYAAPRKRGQPPPRQQAVDQPSYPYGGQGFQDQEQRTMPAPVGAPPRGSRRPGSFTSTKIEGVTTLKPEDGAGYQGALAPGGSPRQHHDTTYTPQLGTSPPPHHGRHLEGTPTRLSGKSPTSLPPEKKKRPVAFCFTACCILFWLLVIAVGVAVLVVYLLYHPQPPRLRVEDATLNAGYIDELPRRRLALNSDLSVLAAISNPNTKIDIVMRYMELDLYFEGNLIGTTAVWPAPLHEGPGGFVLRDVHIVVSEVVLSREDAIAWQNATAKGGPVALHLAGRFHAQLNFGRWLPFKYWIYPRCTLWFDPPPVGRLLRVRC